MLEILVHVLVKLYHCVKNDLCLFRSCIAQAEDNTLLAIYSFFSLIFPPVFVFVFVFFAGSHLFSFIVSLCPVNS